MSSYKRNFQCFNAVGGDGTHRSFLPSIKHHTIRLPRIPHHGMVAHHEPLEGCYLCSEYRHAHALEAVETQATPLYHSHTPCFHHHPHQYAPSRPTGPDGHPLVHSGHHIHHRHNKKVMLVKNSNPSFRRTIILHRRSLRSFGLFLEEVSELMQYHVRKLYTLEGRKVRSQTSGSRRYFKKYIFYCKKKSNIHTVLSVFTADFKLLSVSQERFAVLHTVIYHFV